MTHYSWSGRRSTRPRHCPLHFPSTYSPFLQPLDVGVIGPLKHVWSQILKDFKLEILAAKDDKRVFPSLVAKMWPRVLLPEHLIGVFRRAGLHPLSQDAIPTSKLKVSIPISGSFTDTINLVPAITVSSALCIALTAATTNSCLNPYSSVLCELAQCSVAVFAGPKVWTKPTHYGEALTEEEVVERIRQQEEEKKQRAVKKD